MPPSFWSRDERVDEALIRIGERVRIARHQRGRSQRNLEQLCGVDQTTISRLERGLAPGLRLERFARILAALDTDIPLTRERGLYERLSDPHPRLR